MKKLGAYFVPLHMPASGEVRFEDMILSDAEVAGLRLDHWRSMIVRSRGRGFRLEPGTGSKRKHSRNPRTGDLSMILNGLAVTARYGNKEARRVVAQPAV